MTILMELMWFVLLHTKFDQHQNFGPWSSMSYYSWFLGCSERNPATNAEERLSNPWVNANKEFRALVATTGERER